MKDTKTCLDTMTDKIIKLQKENKELIETNRKLIDVLEDINDCFEGVGIANENYIEQVVKEALKSAAKEN